MFAIFSEFMFYNMIGSKFQNFMLSFAVADRLAEAPVWG